MKRRNFILLSAGTLAAVGIPTVYHFFGTVDYPRVLANPGTLTPILDPKEIKELGLAYRSQVSDESGERILAKRLKEKLPVDDNALSTSFEEVIKKDFADGNTVEVKGWMLSRTEARQCALSSFSPTPSR